MRNIFLIILLGILSTSFNVAKFNKPKFSKIIGKWVYVNSFNNDTVLVFNNMRTMPYHIEFHYCENNLCDTKQDTAFGLFKDNEFKSIYSTHDSVPFRTKISFPIVLSKYKGKREIVHYVIDNKSYGKAYSYTIDYLSKEEMILKETTAFEINGKLMTFYYRYKKMR